MGMELTKSTLARCPRCGKGGLTRRGVGGWFEQPVMLEEEGGSVKLDFGEVETFAVQDIEWRCSEPSCAFVSYVSYDEMLQVLLGNATICIDCTCNLADLPNGLCWGCDAALHRQEAGDGQD